MSQCHDCDTLGDQGGIFPIVYTWGGGGTHECLLIVTGIIRTLLPQVNQESDKFKFKIKYKYPEEWKNGRKSKTQ